MAEFQTILNANAALKNTLNFLLPRITVNRNSGYFKCKCKINEEQIKFLLPKLSLLLPPLKIRLHLFYHTIWGYFECKCTINKEYITFILPHITDRWVWDYFKCKYSTKGCIKFILPRITDKWISGYFKCKCIINEEQIKFVLPHIADKRIWGYFKMQMQNERRIH